MAMVLLPLPGDKIYTKTASTNQNTRGECAAHVMCLWSVDSDCESVSCRCFNISCSSCFRSDWYLGALLLLLLLVHEVMLCVVRFYTLSTIKNTSPRFFGMHSHTRTHVYVNTKWNHPVGMWYMFAFFQH